MNNTGRSSYDPITLEVVNNGLISLCKEMGITLYRTAYSPIFSEGRDFSTALFDHHSEMIAQGVGCPAQLGALQFTVEWCLMEIGIDHLEPDDVIFHNDVYLGGTHLPEFTMIKPIFHKGEVVAVAAVIGHNVDVGGRAPGGFPGDVTDVFQEGIRIPPVKLYKRGVEVEEVWKIILGNIRTPKITRGDLRAMYSGLLTGERRFQELVEKYGSETLTHYMTEIKDYSERRMREELRKIPDGVYRYEDCMEDDGVVESGPHMLRVTVFKKEDTIVLDFSETDPQTKGPINAPYGVTASACYNAIMQLTDPSIPTNQGCFRPVKILAPGGTLLNVNYPAAEFAGNTETHNRIVDVIVGALAPALPDRVTGTEGGSCFNFTYGGDHPETGEAYANYQWEMAGWGARATKDGNNTLNCPCGNSRLQPIEVNENRFPWITERFALATDSGGAGRYRGGLGTIRVMRANASEIVCNAIADRCKIGPPGHFEGKAGGVGGYWFHFHDAKKWITADRLGFKSPSKFTNIVLTVGDRVMIQSSGGGGYGDPLTRDPASVLQDVVEGNISLKSAKDEYGVIIVGNKPNKFTINHKKTRELRRKLRR